MSIFLIVFIGLIALVLGIIGYREKIVRRKLKRNTYVFLLAIFIIFSIVQLTFSLYNKISSESQISELGLKTNAIQTIQIRVYLETANAKTKGNLSYLSLESRVVLVTTDNIVYKFLNSKEITSDQISQNVSRFNCIYEPEDPSQLYGKNISFLKDIKLFSCDYSELLQTSNLSPIPNIFDITIFVNGIDVFIKHETVSIGVLENGTASLDISIEFSNIDDIYSNKLKIKNTE